MIGLDTNVLVRLLVGDDAQQTEMVTKLLREKCTPEEPGFVNLVVICELVWTLRRSYGFDHTKIAYAIALVLDYENLQVEKGEHVASALRSFRAEGGDIADAIIGMINRTNGCEATATFDKRAARLDGFVLVR